MFDGVHPRGETVVQTLATKRVTGNLVALVVGLFDECLNLFQRERRWNDHLAVRRKSEFVCGIKFDPIGPVHQLLADRLSCFPRRIDRLQH